MLPASPVRPHQGQIIVPPRKTTVPMQHMGIHGCFTLFKNGRLRIGRRQGRTTSSSPISKQTLSTRWMLLAGGGCVFLLLYHGTWCSFGTDSLDTVPDTRTNGLGLFGHSRLVNTFRARVLERSSYQLKAAQPAGTRHVQGTANSEEHIL